MSQYLEFLRYVHSITMYSTNLQSCVFYHHRSQMSLRRKHPSRWKQMKYSFAIVSLLQLFGTIKTPAPILDRIPILGTYANSADPVQMPQDTASDQGLLCLLT